MRQWTTTSKTLHATRLKFLGFVVALVLPLSSHASEHLQSHEPQSEAIALGSDAFNPTTFLEDSDFSTIWTNAQAAALNVLDYLRSNTVQETLSDLEDELPKYNRRAHFYGWINADPTTNCFDTRTEVLLRDADRAVEVVFKDSKKCNVARGLWHDPYTGDDFKTSTSIQIDHVVPLKNAYLTGASQWKTSRRCTYSNFLNNNFHLLAVSGHENMSKGGKSPDGYMPPNEAYACEYVAQWMKIKAIWKLKATEDELAAIEDVVQRYRCSTTRFQMASAKLQAERDASFVAPKRCLQLDQQIQGQNSNELATESDGQYSLPFNP